MNAGVVRAVLGNVGGDVPVVLVHQDGSTTGLFEVRVQVAPGTQKVRAVELVARRPRPARR